MIDYHMHLERGPFAIDYLVKFWERAKERGISEIGFTDHTHNFREFRPTFEHLLQPDVGYQYMKDWMAKDFNRSIDDYLTLLHEARAQGIPVKIGIEVDYFREQEQRITDILSRYSFDFILGSIHVIGQWGFDYDPECGWAGRDVDTAYQEYYSALLQAVKSGLFDIIPHFDVIKVFGHRPRSSMVEHYEPVLDAMRDHGLALEISTAGLRKPVGEIYPAEEILSMACAKQIPITFASDAHVPEDVGFAWEDAAVLAGKCGYREYRIFRERKSWAEKLPKI